MARTLDLTAGMAAVQKTRRNPMDEMQRRRAVNEAARGILALLRDFDRLTMDAFEETVTA